MTPFRERSPVKVGAVSIAVLIGFILLALNAGSLPLIGGGDTFYADFTDSSGIKKNDEVRIAGVRVGKVTGLELAGDKVRVKFKVDTSSHFGRQTNAEIRVKTLLGAMYLALVPKGSGQLDEGAVIPTSRTKSAYDVVDAFSGLAQRAQDIDLNQLKTALNTLADATKDTPEELQTTLRGLSAMSANLAARDQQLNTLLGNLRKVSGVLSAHNDDIVTLMKNGEILLNAVVARRDAVHRLLVSTSQLSSQLTALVQQSRADLKPALTNLKSVVDVLRKNQANLDSTLLQFGSFYRIFTNVLGSGPWFDNWIANLPPLPASGGGQ